MPAVEARKPPLGGQILIVLCHVGSAAADRGRVISRFGERVGNAAAEPLDGPPRRPERRGMEHGRSFRRLPEEGLHAGNPQPVRSTVRRAHDVEAGAARFRVAAAEIPDLPDVAGKIRIPRLHQAEGVASIDPIGVRGLARRRARKRIGQVQGLECRADGVVGRGERRLAGELPGDRRGRPGVVADPISAAQDGAGSDTPGDSDPRRDVVRVRVEECLRERAVEGAVFTGDDRDAAVNPGATSRFAIWPERS